MALRRAKGREGETRNLCSEVSMDAFTQQRVLELKQEIAALQRENESYRGRRRHAAPEANTTELIRLRLVAIKEELARMTQPPSRGKR